MCCERRARERLEVRNGKLVEILGDTIQTFTHVGNGRFSGDGSHGFFHTITLGNSGAGARLEMSDGGEIDETLQRVDASAIWRPSASELDEYAGMYFSEDVDAGWQLEHAHPVPERCDWRALRFHRFVGTGRSRGE